MFYVVGLFKDERATQLVSTQTIRICPFVKHLIPCLWKNPRKILKKYYQFIMKLVQGKFSIFKTRPPNDKLFALVCSIEDSRERFKSPPCLTSHMTRTGLHDSPAAVRKCVFSIFQFPIMHSVCPSGFA